MAASPSVVALPWYARGDYPALLKLFSDTDKFPTTYDAWLELAEQVERQFQQAGFGVARIWIRPVPFAAWCKERNVSLDQAARLTFVNAAARGQPAAVFFVNGQCSERRWMATSTFFSGMPRTRFPTSLSMTPPLDS